MRGGDRTIDVENAGSRPESPPRVWLILSDKLGDNAQVRAVAGALSWPCEEKQIRVRGRYIIGKPFVRASLHHVDLDRSDTLEPPWPDLIITIGRRMSMVALWVKKKSHGRTKIVLIGRAQRLLHRFDLVITSMQYRLPPRENVLGHAYPLLRVDEAAIDAAAAEWKAEFESLPRPLVALMVGGPIRTVRFDACIASGLACSAARFAAEQGGTLVVTTSRRTPVTVTEALAASLPKEALLYRWTSEGRNNPYRALLKLADRFIVTGDSISMLVEIACLGRPLAIYPLPPSSWLARPLMWLRRRLHPGRGGQPGPHGLGFGVLGDLLYRLGLIGYTRDLKALHETLVRDELAVWFGDALRPDGPKAPDELPGIVARIRGLMQPH